LKQRKIDKVLILLVLVLGLAACYEDREGCLDILGKNYDVTADAECEDCCTYPSLVFSLTQNIGEDGLTFGDTIINNLGDSIRILDYVYFISNVQVILNSEPRQVLDSLAVYRENDTVYIKEDIIRVARSKARYTVGEFRERGPISEVSFDIGLPAILKGNEVNTSSPNDLVTDPDTLRSDTGDYTVQRLQLSVEEGLKDSTIVDVPDSLLARKIIIPTDTVSVAGIDKVINITVDYQYWFDDIDFQNDSDEEIAKQLQTNLSKAFDQ